MALLTNNDKETRTTTTKKIVNEGERVKERMEKNMTTLKQNKRSNRQIHFKNVTLNFSSRTETNT